MKIIFTRDHINNLRSLNDYEKSPNNPINSNNHAIKINCDN